ncbi:hypothetical protein NHQ30_002160 [Ciborinia camelliae]|nr:hypothetical protein NHQ30_002160 [Ciborinia camelliae]
MDNFQDLANMTLDVYEKPKATDSQRSEKSEVLTPSFQPLAEFKPFSRLPAELRVRIWRLALCPRLIEERFCRHDFGDGIQDLDWRERLPGKPHTIPYSSMPGVFRACRESREEITRYYQQPALGGPCGAGRKTIWDSRDIGYFKGVFCPVPCVPFNPDQDILSFDSLFTEQVRVRDEPDVYAFLVHDIPLPANIPPFREGYFQEPNEWLIKPWVVKRLQIKPRSLFDEDTKDHEVDVRAIDFLKPWDRIFFRFIFQNLEEFIVQDYDCKFSHCHSFSSDEGQNKWRQRILKMFEVETSHDEYEDMRGGLTHFKIPKIVIRPGAKIARPCAFCGGQSKRIKERKKLIKRQRQQRHWREALERRKYGGYSVAESKKIKEMKKLRKQCSDTSESVGQIHRGAGRGRVRPICPRSGHISSQIDLRSICMLFIIYYLTLIYQLYHRGDSTSSNEA